LLCGQAVVAQKNRGNLNLPDYDDKQLHYGFLLGVNLNRYQIYNTPQYASNEYLLNPKFTPGFSLGLVATYQFSEYFGLRFSPQASFNERVLEFTNLQTGEVAERRIESTIVDFPLLIKLKAQRRGNTRAYLLAGIKPSIALGVRKVEEANLVRAENFDVALEYGIGLDRFFQMFKFAPEIRISHGLRNIFIPDDNPFSNQINRLYNHSISIYFFFE
jgi:hypothetical protein